MSTAQWSRVQAKHDFPAETIHSITIQYGQPNGLNPCATKLVGVPSTSQLTNYGDQHMQCAILCTASLHGRGLRIWCTVQCLMRSRHALPHCSPSGRARAPPSAECVAAVCNRSSREGGEAGGGIAGRGIVRQGGQREKKQKTIFRLFATRTLHPSPCDVLRRTRQACATVGRTRSLATHTPFSNHTRPACGPSKPSLSPFPAASLTGPPSEASERLCNARPQMLRCPLLGVCCGVLMLPLLAIR